MATWPARRSGCWFPVQSMSTSIPRMWNRMSPGSMARHARPRWRRRAQARAGAGRREQPRPCVGADAHDAGQRGVRAAKAGGADQRRDIGRSPCTSRVASRAVIDGHDQKYRRAGQRSGDGLRLWRHGLSLWGMRAADRPPHRLSSRRTPPRCRSAGRAGPAPPTAVRKGGRAEAGVRGSLVGLLRLVQKGEECANWPRNVQRRGQDGRDRFHRPDRGRRLGLRAGARRAQAQSEKRRCGHSRAMPSWSSPAFPGGQIVAGLRHALCRGAAPLSGIGRALCPPPDQNRPASPRSTPSTACPRPIALQQGAASPRRGPRSA